MFQKLKILRSIHEKLMSESDLDSVLNSIVKQATKLLKADRCTLYLYDPIEEELWSKIASKLEINEIRLKSGQGIAGQVAKTLDIINVSDAYADERFNKQFDEAINYKTETLLAAPMINLSGQLIGVMQLINKQESKKVFDKSDEFMISILAGVSAVALQQAQLYESNFKLRKYNEIIIERINNGLLVLDEGYKVVLANPYFSNIFELEEGELENKNIFDEMIFCEDFKKYFDKAKNEQNCRIVERKIWHKGKTKYLNISFSYVEDSENNPMGYILIVSDMTNEVLLREEQKKKDHLSLIGKMLSTIIHDIKNPLSAIKGFSQLIERKVEDKDIKKYADVIRKEIDRLDTMTREILDFARGKTTLNKIEINACDILDDLVPSVEMMLKEKNMKFVSKLDEDFSIYVDPQKIRRAIMNIAKNSIEAMEEHKGIFEVEFKKVDDKFHVLLSDNGKGIPKEIHKEIFQPFYTSGKTNGTGLGLAIVKKIILEHQGRILLKSEDGVGTSFILEFPIE